MSWAVEEWKQGLSTKVLHKIQELESQLEKLRKERQQRQFQLESLEAALQKQKQKVENEKNEGATLKRENQSLIELCGNLEKTKQKLSHELQVKESQVSFQEGQLLSSKKQVERLEQDLKKYKSELEKIQQNLVAEDSSFSSTPQKSFTVPSIPSHNDSRYEEMQAKYMQEVEENKKLEAELKSMKSHKANPLIPQTTMSCREIARQQASSSVFSWQQEQTPNCPPSNSQTPMNSGLHFPWELGSTPSHQDLQSAKKGFANSILDKSKNSPLIDKMKIQNQELRSRVQELEHNLQIQTSDVKSHITKLQETRLQVENLKRELTEKNQTLNKSNNEITRITAQRDQTAAQFVATEEKMKRLSEELKCQQQNAESVRHSLEQKVKEKEKEYQEELSCQLDQVRTKLQEELQQAKINYSRLQADLEKIELEKQQSEQSVSDFTLRLNAADQAMETMQLKENELRRNFEEVKKQNSLLSYRSGQQLQEICQLKEDLCMTKQLLQQNQSLSEEMKSKNWSMERELETLKDKVNKQDESVEKMQLALSDLEKQRDSLQQLLNHKEKTIEKLCIKLEDLERLQNVLAKCEILKKEVEILSHRKKENEQQLDQFRSEKEELRSKMYSLENALMTEQIRSNDRVTVAEAENERLRTEIKSLQCVVEGKSTELEEQRIAYCELQRQSVTFEETYQKERENNSLKLSESTKQMNLLQQILQSTTHEISEKKKRIASLETSLASHTQLNVDFQKQFEELIQVRDEMERKLTEAVLKHEGFVRESKEHIGKLCVALSEKQVIVTKASAAVEEKDKELQLPIKELLEDLVQQLQAMPQTASYQEPDLLAAASLSDKEIKCLKDKNVCLQSAIDTLEQRHVNIMETNLYISNNSQDQHENLSELSKSCREKSTLLQAKEGLERNCTSLEAKDNNLEHSLRVRGLPFEVEKTEFEYREKKLMNRCEELYGQLLSSEEKIRILLRQLEVVLEEAESAPVQKMLSAELSGLESKRMEQNTVQQHYGFLLQKNKQLIEEIKIRNNHTTGAFALFGVSLEQLRLSVKEKEDKLDKYQVKLELIQKDLEDNEVAVKNYADQVQKLETALRAMEVKIEESEREKQGLKQEIQALKNLENLTSGLAEGDGNARSPAIFNAVSKDNFSQQIDAKCSSVPHDLTSSQNDYVQLVSSLHMTVSKLNELEKICEHLQIERSTLASQLKGSQLECITDSMAEELRAKINTINKERITFSDELNQSEMEKQIDFEKMIFMDLESCSGVNYEDLKLSHKEIKTHFDGVKEKILSLKNQYQYLYDQNVSMFSKLSEFQCVIEMLKKESTALSGRPSQANTVSLVCQMTPCYINKEFLLDGSLCLWSSSHSSMASLAESNFDSDQYRPPNEITEQYSSNKQSKLGCTPDIPHQITELCADSTLVHIIKQGHVVPKMYSLECKREHLMLFDTYDKSFERLRDSLEIHKNLEDEEIQKIQQLLLSAKKEVNCLQQQNVLDNEQWQQKPHNVILEVVSKLPVERIDTEILSSVLEEPRLRSQGLNSSQPLLSFGSEYQVQVPVTESRMVSDQSTSSSQSPAVLLLNCHNTNTVPENIPEYHRSAEMSPQQINETCTLLSKPPHDMNESSKAIDTLVMEVQNLNSRLDSQDAKLAMKTAACVELEKTVVELEKEKEDLSETLKSVTLDNQQLSYNLLSLETELGKVKSDLDMYKVRLSDTEEILEDLEMAKSDQNEQLLEAENEVRRIKAERENIETHALSMEADIEELQSKKEQLEKENENKLKTILGLQEELHIITVERNQFSKDLNALSKDKEELDYMCQKLQDRIKDLQSSQRDSTEFIRVLESEAKTQTKLLCSANDDIAQLSTEKGCLVLQLQNLGKVASDLVLEKEMAQSQIELLNEEKEVILREYETLQTQLSNSETEISRISKSLEGSLIEKGELAARLNSAQEETDQLRQGIEKLKIKIESDEKKRYCLAKKLKESAMKTDSLVDKVENLERELQLSEENFEGAILQVEVTKEEKEMADSELEKMHANLSKLEAEMNLVKSERERLERELEEEQEKASHLECSNSMLVKQLEGKEVQIRSGYENALMSIQSQLNQAREEIKVSHSKLEMYKAKEQELVDEITSLQHENTQLAHHLQQAKDKHSEAEELMGALIQELQDIKLQLDENDSFLEQLARTEALHAALEDPQASCKDPEEDLGATASEKGASIEKACYYQLLEQLKNGEKNICPKFQQWMRSFRMLKQEREQMLMQICEFKIQLKRPEPRFVDTMQILEMDYFPENPKATAEGSKLQKIDDAQLQEMQATGSSLGFTPRSPLSSCNQSIQPIVDRSAGSSNTIKTRLSNSTIENELNEGCHVQ